MLSSPRLFPSICHSIEFFPVIPCPPGLHTRSSRIPPPLILRRFLPDSPLISFALSIQCSPVPHGSAFSEPSSLRSFNDQSNVQHSFRSPIPLRHVILPFFNYSFFNENYLSCSSPFHLCASVCAIDFLYSPLYWPVCSLSDPLLPRFSPKS